MTRALFITVLALAVLASTLPGRNARATSTVSTVSAGDHAAIVALGGLRDGGITITAPVIVSDTVVSVTNGMPFIAGQAIEVKPPSGPTELMIVVSATGDGDPSNDGTGGIQERVTVVRAQYGTAAIAHASGEIVYSEFTRFNARVDQLSPRNTSATLAAPLDAGTFDATPGILASSVTSGDTTFYVSDPTIVSQGDAIKIDSEQMTVTDARRGFVGPGTPPVANGSGALLSGAITAAATTFAVTDGTKFPSPPPPIWRIKVENEEMRLVSVSGNNLTVTRGYNGTTAATHGAFKDVLEGLVEVSTNFDQLIATTTVNISDKTPLAAGNIALIDNEEFLITALAGDGFGAAQDTMTMVRAYDSTINVPHLAGASVYSGRDRITVTRAQNGTTAAAHAALAAIQSVGRIASVSTQTGLSSSSTLLIDSERLKVLGLPANTLHPGGATLIANVTSATSDTLVPLSSIANLSVGQTIGVDAERMAITTEAPACAPTGSPMTQQSLPNSGGTGVVVNIDDFTMLNFAASCSIKVENEEMLVTDVAGDGAAGVQDTMTVTRAWNNTSFASHVTNKPLLAGRAAARVYRALNGTIPAAHSNGATVSIIGEEANKVRLSRAEPGGGAIASHSSGAAISDVDGLAAYLFTATLTAPGTGVTTTDPMDTSVTTVGVSSVLPLQAGWTVIVDSEKLKIVPPLVGDGPGGVADYINVQRAYAGTAAAPHTAGLSVRGPVLAEFAYARNGSTLTETGRTLNTLSCGPANVVRDVEWMSYSCATDGMSPLGPIADDQQPLATMDIIPRVLLPATPSRTMNFTGSLADVTGDDFSATFVSGTARVVRCPDVNADRVANFPGDVITIAKASFNIVPPVFPKMDINNDNVINFPGDAITAAKVVVLGQPGALRCVPLP